MSKRKREDLLVEYSVFDQAIGNQKVIECFKAGVPFSKGNLRSTGTKLFSYKLCIAERIDGFILVYDYTASGRFVSATTSKHVGMVKRTFPENSTGKHLTEEYCEAIHISLSSKEELRK